MKSQFNENVLEAKRLFHLRGQINESIISREIAVSWQKCKLFGMNVHDLPRLMEDEVEYDDHDFVAFCDHIIPEYTNYFISDWNGNVLHKRIWDKELDIINNLSDDYIGTSSFSISLNLNKDYSVRFQEHYLDLLTEFVSRTIYIDKSKPFITIFTKGVENEYLSMSVKNSILTYSNEKVITTAGVVTDVSLDMYLDLAEYDLVELKHEIERVMATGLPILVLGKNADALAWYIADKTGKHSTRFSGEGIPQGKIEEKLVDHSSKTTNLIIGRLSKENQRLYSAVTQIVSYMTETHVRKKKMIIVTADEREMVESIASILSLSTIHLDNYVLERKREFYAVDLSKIQTLAEVEEREIRNALTASKWNISNTSKALGIGRATLYRKIKLYNIDTRADRD